jgi:NAD(P)-dependent dehydrogenase (short-subunit alcohol dehydrogenase family)
VEQTVRAFGQLDVFVGNAGVFDGFVSLADIPEDRLSLAFDELFAVNVKGCLLGAKTALPELLKTEGCMIFTASLAGFGPGGGGPLYTASKHAVVGLIRQLAAELAPRIRVNGVAPGGVRTDLRGLAVLHQSEASHWAAHDVDWGERMRAGVPLQIELQPGDIAAACAFLASKENARAMTGVIVHVDAGSSVRMLRRS